MSSRDVVGARLREQTTQHYPMYLFAGSNWDPYNGANQNKASVGISSTRIMWDFSNSHNRYRAKVYNDYFNRYGWEGYQYLDPFRFADLGSPFELIAQKYDSPPPPTLNLKMQRWFDQYPIYYRGPVFASIYEFVPNSAWCNNITFTRDAIMGRIGNNFADLDSQGTQGMLRSSRNKPRAQISNALYELRSMKGPGLRKTPIPAKELKALRGGGAQDYLQLVYGFLPTIGDIKAMLASAMKADELLDQLRAGANRPMRRSWKFQPEETTTVTVGSPTYVGAPVSDSRLWRSYGTLTTTTTIAKKQWFSGKEIYGYPIGKDIASRVKATAADARYLYGLDLTPETIWNAIPWSWFVDWFINIGDMFAMLDSVTWDGNIWMYAYICEESTTSVRYDWSGAVDLYGQPHSHTQVFSVSRKRRGKATPFGFGINEAGLTLNQTSVLAALGASYGGRN